MNSLEKTRQLLPARTPLDAELIEHRIDQTTQPFLPGLRLPEWGLRMDSPLRPRLQVALHTAFGQRRGLGQLSNRLLPAGFDGSIDFPPSLTDIYQGCSSNQVVGTNVIKE